jgi:hypothetical protein
MLIETLDLHGYTLVEAMNRFIARYNRLAARHMEGNRQEMRALEVIHGKGKGDSSGTIRDALRHYLSRHGTRIRGFDAHLVMLGSYSDLQKYAKGRLAYIYGEDADGNAGKTIVLPGPRLPRYHQY